MIKSLWSKLWAAIMCKNGACRVRFTDPVLQWAGPCKCVHCGKTTPGLKAEWLESVPKYRIECPSKDCWYETVSSDINKKCTVCGAAMEPQE